MTDTKSTFYLFALTPRAGKHNHVHIQPKAVPLFRETPEDEGEDRVNVNRIVKQLTLDTPREGDNDPREGDEQLFLVAPKRRLSTEEKIKIGELLTNYQDRLAELVTKKIDWDKWDKKDGSSIKHPDLDQWMNELQPKVANILGTEISDPPEGWINLIMRHKNLCAVIVLMVFLAVTAIKGQGFLKSLVDGGNIRIDPSGWFTQSESDVRDDWIRALEIQGQFQLPQFPPPTQQQKNELQQQKEQAIVQKLNSLFEEKKHHGLHDCLLALNGCFGNPIAGTKPELQQLLENEKLRGDIAAVNSNRMSKLIKYRNDEVEQTLHRYFSEGKPDERAKRFVTLRQLLTATIEIGKKVESAEPMPNDLWVNFARLLYSGSDGYFLKEGKDLSAGYQENIAEYQPQFVTTADLELSRVVYHWLTGPNAKSLIGDGSGNLQSALVAVAQSSERESPFTAAEKFKYNVGTMNEKEKALYNDFLEFRKCAEAIVRQLETNE